MSLTIDMLNSPTVTQELRNPEVELIDGWFGVRNCKSGKLMPQPQSMQLENTLCMPKPSKLAGDISTFDFTELRNYIYGVNGRY